MTEYRIVDQHGNQMGCCSTKEEAEAIADRLNNNPGVGRIWRVEEVKAA